VKEQRCVAVKAVTNLAMMLEVLRPILHIGDIVLCLGFPDHKFFRASYPLVFINMGN
jgi:hypothetical protein